MEVDETIEFSNDEKMNKLKNMLLDGIRNHLYISANVILVATGTLARSEGKAVRVIDKRSS